MATVNEKRTSPFHTAGGSLPSSAEGGETLVWDDSQNMWVGESALAGIPPIPNFAEITAINGSVYIKLVATSDPPLGITGFELLYSDSVLPPVQREPSPWEPPPWPRPPDMDDMEPKLFSEDGQYKIPIEGDKYFAARTCRGAERSEWVVWPCVVDIQHMDVNVNADMLDVGPIGDPYQSVELYNAATDLPVYVNTPVVGIGWTNPVGQEAIWRADLGNRIGLHGGYIVFTPFLEADDNLDFSIGWTDPTSPNWIRLNVNYDSFVGAWVYHLASSAGPETVISVTGESYRFKLYLDDVNGLILYRWTYSPFLKRWRWIQIAALADENMCNFSSNWVPYLRGNLYAYCANYFQINAIDGLSQSCDCMEFVNSIITETEWGDHILTRDVCKETYSSVNPIMDLWVSDAGELFLDLYDWEWNLLSSQKVATTPYVTDITVGPDKMFPTIQQALDYLVGKNLTEPITIQCDNIDWNQTAIVHAHPQGKLITLKGDTREGAGRVMELTGGYVNNGDGTCTVQASDSLPADLIPGDWIMIGGYMENANNIGCFEITAVDYMTNKVTFTNALGMTEDPISLPAFIVFCPNTPLHIDNTGGAGCTLTLEEGATINVVGFRFVRTGNENITPVLLRKNSLLYMSRCSFYACGTAITLQPGSSIAKLPDTTWPSYIEVGLVRGGVGISADHAIESENVFFISNATLALDVIGGCFKTQMTQFYNNTTAISAKVAANVYAVSCEFEGNTVNYVAEDYATIQDEVDVLANGHDYAATAGDADTVDSFHASDMTRLISVPTTITVGAGKDFATIQEAWDSLKGMHIIEEVIIAVDPGVWSEALVLEAHPDGDKIKIVGDERFDGFFRTGSFLTGNFVAGGGIGGDECTVSTSSPIPILTAGEYIFITGNVTSPANLGQFEVVSNTNYSITYKNASAVSEPVIELESFILVIPNRTLSLSCTFKGSTVQPMVGGGMPKEGGVIRLYGFYCPGTKFGFGNKYPFTAIYGVHLEVWECVFYNCLASMTITEGATLKTHNTYSQEANIHAYFDNAGSGSSVEGGSFNSLQAIYARRSHVKLHYYWDIRGNTSVWAQLHSTLNVQFCYFKRKTVGVQADSCSVVDVYSMTNVGNATDYLATNGGIIQDTSGTILANAIEANYANTAGDADTVDGLHGSDLRSKLAYVELHVGTGYPYATVQDAIDYLKNYVLTEGAQVYVHEDITGSFDLNGLETWEPLAFCGDNGTFSPPTSQVDANVISNIVDVSADKAEITYVGGMFPSDKYIAGNEVRIYGCTNAGNNGRFVIDSVAGKTVTIVNAGAVTEVPPATARIVSLPMIKCSNIPVNRLYNGPLTQFFGFDFNMGFDVSDECYYDLRHCIVDGNAYIRASQGAKILLEACFVFNSPLSGFIAKEGGSIDAFWGGQVGAVNSARYAFEAEDMHSYVNAVNNLTNCFGNALGNYSDATVQGIEANNTVNRLMKALDLKGVPGRSIIRDEGSYAGVGDGTNDWRISPSGIVTLHGTSKRVIAVSPGIDYNACAALALVNVGAYTAWRMQVNEFVPMEFRIPYNWDGASDLKLHIITCTNQAQTVGTKFNYELRWNNKNLVSGVLPATFNTIALETTILAGRNNIYDIYVLEFTIDWDSVVPNLVRGDYLGMRLVRVANGTPGIGGDHDFVDAYLRYTIDNFGAATF